MNSEPIPESAAAAASLDPLEAERLSAWLDGELDARAAEPVMAQLLRQRPWRQRYADWCMVGDALRSHEVAAEHSPHLCARISRALQDEPALLAPRFLPANVKHHLASGVAVAAAVAVLVLVAVPQLRGVGAISGAPAGSPAVTTAASGNATEAVPAAHGEPDTEPAAVALATQAGQGRPAGNSRLDPYLQAHRDFSGGGVMPAAAVYLRFGSEGER